MRQNIKLAIGNRGHRLSISQGVGSGSFADSHVEVALENGGGEYVDTVLWWDDADDNLVNSLGKSYAFSDTVISYININDLADVILKATAWVGERQ